MRLRRRVSRLAFYLHLWVGVATAAVVLAIAVTGVLLNHKKSLGLMPVVSHEPSGDFGDALSLEGLARIALDAVPAEISGVPGRERAFDPSRIDRMDVRPENGYVKVRLRDAASTEVTLDLATGSVLHVGERGDVFLEKLHSGEVFGGGFILLSDLAAVGLLLTLVTGIWLWLVPKFVTPYQVPAPEDVP